MAITITRTAPVAAPANATATTGTAAGDLTSGKTYYYRICAKTASGGSGIEGVPCAEISAVADANGSIDLSWDAVAGAGYYYVWRTPTSGDYSLNYNAGANLAKDTHSMLLNNNLTAATMYTTTGTSLTDLGTATERSSSHAYYRWFHNHFLYENGRGRIDVDTTSSDISSFDDIYTDAVANGYDTNFFKKLYDAGCYRIFESIDDIYINGDFADYNFKVIYHNNLYFSNDSDYSRTIGKYIYFNNMASYVVCGHSEFVNYNPVGRKMNNGLNLYYTNCYGLRMYRDYGVAEGESYVNTSNTFSLQSGSLGLKKTLMKECTIAGDWQQINLSTEIDMDNVILEKNHRGFSINDSQADSSFNNVFFNNYQYDTTGKYTTTLRGCTFFNASGAGIHRFYDCTNVDRILLDCKFPGGHGLPRSASQAVGNVGNTLTLKWSFDLMVIDENNNPLDGATVELTDSQGNLTTVTTDSNGVITTQEMIQAVYTRATNDDGNFDTTTTYNDYDLRIRKSGYKEHRESFALEDTTNFIISLKKNRFREERSR